MKILLTGASGMVGSSIAAHRAMAKDDLLTPSHSELDLTERGTVSEWLSRHQPDLVLHCAGVVGGVRANLSEPARFLSENMLMAMNLITEARRVGVRQFLNVASSCMYPRNAPNPLREEQILTGELEASNEGYALAKSAATRLCDYVSRECPDYLYKTIVPCNLYGINDHFDEQRGHLIAAAIHKTHLAKRNSAPNVTVWGDGTARREFMYTGDLADFVAVAISRFSELPGVMNVGPGVDWSVNDYYRIIATVVGYHGQTEWDTRAPVGVMRKLMDVSRLEAFGWAPRVGLSEGLKKTYDHYRSVFND